MGLQPTYEGLKPVIREGDAVDIQGFAAYLRGIETPAPERPVLLCPLCLQPTYEGLKLLRRGACLTAIGTFAAYLRGIETCLAGL